MSTTPPPAAALVHVDRNAATVVDDRHRAVDVNRDGDVLAETGQRLVDRVVDDFVDEVMQPGRTGRSDVHRRALADGFQAFEDFDLVCAIVLGGAGQHRARHLPGLAVFESVFDIQRFCFRVPSDPHRHDHVGVLVPLRANRLHDRLAHLVLELEPDVLGFHHAEKVVDVVRVEADLIASPP